MFNKIKHTVQEGTSKFIKAVAIVGTTLLITLNVWANQTNAAVKKEIKDIFKSNPDKEIVVKMENEQPSEKMAKFEQIKDSIDPYDQIREYVSPADTTYFSQLKKHMETKESNEQIKCKAVVYVILQDTLLTTEQKKILSLSQFEILAKMPGSDYRFSKKSGERLKTHPDDLAYKDRVQRYLAYKTYLSNLALDQEIAKLKEKSKQLDREIQLLEKLLNTYKQK